jgi:hypothetical protein
VVEHLPARNNRAVARMLTAAAPAVMFSSALPGQGGAHHINEQWPSYWRALFAECGFEMLDPIAPRLMYDERVAWWYRQNIVLFASQALLSTDTRLRELADAVAGKEREWVHVEMIHRYRSLGCILRQAPGAMWRVINRLYLKGTGGAL